MNVAQLKTPEINESDEVKYLLKLQISKYPNLSHSDIDKSLDISRGYTLKMLRNKKKTAVQAQTLYNIIMNTFNAEGNSYKISTILKRYENTSIGKKIAKLLNKNLIEIESKNSPKNLQSAFSTDCPVTTAILASAITSHGISIKSVEQKYGQFGINILNEFIKKNILHLKDGVIKIKYESEDSVLMFEQEISKIMTKNIINSYDPKKLLSGGNFLSLAYESLNVRARNKIIREARAFNLKIKDIINDEDSKTGTTAPFFISTVADKLFEEDAEILH